MDPINRRRFWDLIYQLSGEGVTVFVTTHYMDEAEYCDRLGLIYRGELIACQPPETLKRDFMPGEVIDLACERPYDAIPLLETLAGVREVSLFGDDLHIVCDRAEPSIPKIKNLLEQRGIEVSGLRIILPSLEDVFVAQIAERDRTLAGQAEVER